MAVPDLKATLFLFIEGYHSVDETSEVLKYAEVL